MIGVGRAWPHPNLSTGGSPSTIIATAFADWASSRRAVWATAEVQSRPPGQRPASDSASHRIGARQLQHSHRTPHGTHRPRGVPLPRLGCAAGPRQEGALPQPPVARHRLAMPRSRDGPRRGAHRGAGRGRVADAGARPRRVALQRPRGDRQPAVARWRRRRSGPPRRSAGRAPW
jgi:hypothetical protein